MRKQILTYILLMVSLMAPAQSVKELQAQQRELQQQLEQTSQMLNGLMGRAVFANADGIVRHDIGEGQFHERGQTHCRFAVIGEYEEGCAIRLHTAVQLHTVCNRRHCVFTNTEVHVRTGL